MDDINELLNEVKAAAARRAAIERESALIEARAQGEVSVVAEPVAKVRAANEGILTVERKQGQWRCFLGGERIRSGETFEVYVNEAIGWVRGKLHWGRRPTTPPAMRLDATDPHRIDDNGLPMPLGEFELALPEDALCRWPLAT